jgi:hypothetical protein
MKMTMASSASPANVFPLTRFQYHLSSETNAGRQIKVYKLFKWY